jgi:hypothetical protein
MSLIDNQADSKSIFLSKTFWLSLLSAPVGYLASKYLIGMPPDAVVALTQALAALAVANIGTRLVTKQPVHILPPKA